MKAIFKPLYLFIAGSVLVLALLLYFLFGGGTTKPSGLGVVRIARDPTWAPLELADKMRQFVAFTDELLMRFSRDAEIQIQVLEDSPAGLYPDLWRGSFHAIITSTSPPPSLPALGFLYSENYYDFGTVLVVRTGSKVVDLQGLKGNIVGVVHGTPVPAGIGVDPSMLVISYDSAFSALDSLANGNIDGALMPFMRAYSLSRGLYNGQVRIATSPIVSQGVRMVVRRSPTGQFLIDAFNKALEAMHDDGAYDTFLKHWGLPDSQKVATPPGLTDGSVAATGPSSLRALSRQNSAAIVFAVLILNAC